ncbi:MAG: alanine--tRNA ligase [Alphaproteobacteria bacterium]|nr:alanine--tRNA ligase [Alphaproteobacteria bacterium]
MFSANYLRREFLEYFRRHNHEIVSSSSLIPQNDPTLLFTNAGMVQFKNVFTGLEKRNYKRAVTAQKCIRAGGKHNDLENVGYTARHHTFFEMLGNFSFGDYFKEQAIYLAWNFIANELGINKDKLSITVYHDDNDAYNLWHKISGLDTKRIIRIASSDNFWSMGDTGPCGPCSEIFYDHGSDIPGGPPGSTDADGDRFIEIWNLVFMQYEQISKEQRINLPSPSIDTGMGLERLTAVLQGKHDNYDIDSIRSLIEDSAALTKTDPDGTHKNSHRVIADHIRSSCFLIAEGILPSNEGRGYVLRRIMRRAMRHVHKIGYQDALMWQLVPTLINVMGQAYPELEQTQDLIVETLKLEETRFKETLARGLKLLDEEIKKLGSGKSLSGEVAFKLYDTYGFPLDLTQDILRGHNLAVNLDTFNQIMNQQKEQARKAWVGSGEKTTENLWFDLYQKYGPTEFLGYTTDETEGKILSLCIDGKEVSTAPTGSDIIVIANQTPFYAESGGQVGDKGTLTDINGLLISISNTHKKVDGLYIHYGQVIKGTVHVNQTVTMKIDKERRNNLRSNHSATHLLHQALRKILGKHVTQKGSLVEVDKLRFDFSHNSPLTEDEIAKIEEEVNKQIRRNTKANVVLMETKDAINQGALALFSEKYADQVRVVSMGHEDDHTRPFSTELCGGTHVNRTGDIGFFKISGQSSVGSGVRRIEAVTGRYAELYVRDQQKIINDLATKFKINPENLASRINTFLEEYKMLKNKPVQISSNKTQNNKEEKIIGKIKLFSLQLNEQPKDLKGIADTLKREIGSGIILLINQIDTSISLIVAVTNDLTHQFDAVKLVRLGAEILGGKGGGGRKDMAQAGGNKPEKIKDCIEAIENEILKSQ